MSNVTDQTPSRATFKCTYPSSIQIITKASSNTTIKQKDLILNQNWDNFQNITFEECRPKYDALKFKESAKVTNCAFKDCVFHKCFLGSCLYKGVSFSNCVFDQSDFMNATFEDCTFTGCTFTNCTAWRISFKNTIISSDAFLRGTTFPTKNYSPNDKKIKYYIFKHQKNRLDFASEMIRSAMDKFDSGLLDQALFNHKKELARYYSIKINTKFNYSENSFERRKKIAIDTLHLLQIRMINLLSNGGTSISKIVVLAAIIIFGISPLVFDNIEAVSQMANGKALVIKDQSYWFKVICGIELFLGYGYTAIQAVNTQSKIILGIMPTVGLITLSVFLHTLIKKVYRW